MLKYAFDKRKLKGKFPEILAIGLAHGSDDQQAALLIYSLSRVDFTEEQIKEVVKELPLAIKEKVMSTYDLLIEKGIEKGKASVVANLLLDFGFNDEQAARASQTSIDFVRKVRTDLNKQKK